MPIDPAKPYDLRYQVMPDQDRKRLDLYVKAMIPSMSRTRIQQRIDEGRVEVNGARRPANWRVLAGDNVLIRCREPEGGAEPAAAIPLDVLYEDADIIAVNKQPGLIVHPVGKHRHDTLLNALFQRCRNELGENETVNLANRLDQYTSGVILATKHAAAKRIIQEDFENRVPKKSYRALCRGEVRDDEGVIDLPIGPEQGGDHCRMAVRTDGEGKEALTRYAVEKRFSGFTLVKLMPVTGRQHQLRVHLSAIGHPLAADARYGGGYRLELRDRDGGTAALERYALHASELSFTHPVTGGAMHCFAPLAADLEAIVRALGNGAEEVVAGSVVSRKGNI